MHAAELVYERDVEVHSRRVRAEKLLTEIKTVVEQEKEAADNLYHILYKVYMRKRYSWNLKPGKMRTVMQL